MENKERVKWTYEVLESVGFVKHKVVVGNSHNYIKGDFIINDAYPRFNYKGQNLPLIIYLDDLAGIYFEKTGEYLKIETIMKQELITAKDIADDVQQSFEIPNSYRKLLEDRISKLLDESNDKLLLTAYLIGWNDAIAGDDVSSVDLQSNEEIIKHIKSTIKKTN